jgi:hypothetical protein
MLPLSTLWDAGSRDYEISRSGDPARSARATDLGGREISEVVQLTLIYNKCV